ncbi:MAG TPA: HD domain-containing protein [Tepidisphaeraceae bacterium]|jgi:3'-5' exoribonuclease|nr:HD domain-containing protein [Tepidisphaeraceae bacterium]
MRTLFLKQSVPGDCLEDIYLITGKQFSATSNGKFFIKAFIGDRSGQITARMWNATREIFNAIPDSGFVRVRGRLENYQNNLQFIIEQISPAKDGTYDIADLMPTTTRNCAVMRSQLQELLDSLQNRHVAALVQAYVDDDELMTNFCKAPAAMSFHHSFIGGLLEHTLNAMQVANAIVPFYPGLNRDLCLAGIFLHDIAKTWELSYDTAFSYTDGGQLVGHVVKAAMWVDGKAKIAEQTLGEPIPEPLINVIQHIILSHHGLPEHGAARIPSTPEAIFVHTIENLDAKMMMALSACRDPEAPTSSDGAPAGHWTEFMKPFNGRLFRPDVAPEDLDENGRPFPPAPKSAKKKLDGIPALSNPLFETLASKKK